MISTTLRCVGACVICNFCFCLQLHPCDVILALLLGEDYACDTSVQLEAERRMYYKCSGLGRAALTVFPQELHEFASKKPNTISADHQRSVLGLSYSSAKVTLAKRPEAQTQACFLSSCMHTAVTYAKIYY